MKYEHSVIWHIHHSHNDVSDYLGGKTLHISAMLNLVFVMFITTCKIIAKYMYILTRDAHYIRKYEHVDRKKDRERIIIRAYYLQNRLIVIRRFQVYLMLQRLQDPNSKRRIKNCKE